MNKSFEDQWKNAFDEASHTPPPEIWDRIDENLNKKKSIFFLWRNPILLSGVAASFLLVLGTLWLFNQNISEVNTAISLPSVEKSETAINRNKLDQTASILNEDETVLKKPQINTANKKTELSLASKNTRNKVKASIQKSKTQTAIVSGTNKAMNNIGTLNKANIAASLDSRAKLMTLDNVEPFESINSTEESMMKLQQLMPIALTSLATIIPIYKDQLTVLQKPQITNSKKESWISFAMAGSPFNPNFSSPQFQQQALSAVQSSDEVFKSFPDISGVNNPIYTNSARTDVESTFKKGTAMTFGFSVGKKLKNKFSLESGIHYTKATATQTYNVYALDTKTGETESFFTSNYILNNKTDKQTLISVNGSSELTYNFISVPLFLNYNLLQFGKINVDAVAGLSGEIFINGSSKEGDQAKKKLNAHNSNFKPINLAGNAGLRISYLITPNLLLNLGTNYQHFLTSGVASNADVSFKPNGLGLNVGLTMNR